MMCHHDSSKVPGKWDAGRCNAGTGDCSSCLLCKIIYSDWDGKYLQFFSQKRKEEKRKERMCFDEVKAQNKPGSLLTVPRFAEI